MNQIPPFSGNRRTFLRIWALLWTSLLGAAACESGENKPAQAPEAPPLPPATPPPPCEDLSGLSAVELEKRKGLGYVPESPQPDMRCDNCKLWLPDKANSPCGNCMLFKGPVHPKGYCTYWASREEG